jgi:hypothetical protein
MARPLDLVIDCSMTSPAEAEDGRTAEHRAAQGRQASDDDVPTAPAD